jgi:hypothetical protein
MTLGRIQGSGRQRWATCPRRDSSRSRALNSRSLVALDCRPGRTLFPPLCSFFLPNPTFAEPGRQLQILMRTCAALKMVWEHLAVVPAAFGDADVVKCANCMPSAVHHGHFLGPDRDSKPHVMRLGWFNSLGLDAGLRDDLLALRNVATAGRRRRGATRRDHFDSISAEIIHCKTKALCFGCGRAWGPGAGRIFLNAAAETMS